MGTGQEYLAFPTERHFYYRVVSDDDAYISDYGEYISDGEWDFSPVAMTAAFDTEAGTASRRDSGGVSGGSRAARGLTVLAVGVLLAVGAAGCGGDEPPPGRTVTTTDFLGQPVREAFGEIGYIPNGGPLPSGLGITTYEMGPAITKKASLPDPGNAGVEWLTVAACYSDTPEKQLTLGVIPMADSTPQIVATAKDRGYDGLVRGCPGTSTTFVYPPTA